MDIAGSTFDGLVSREWLATNALGGYASSTVPGCNTRKYHGLLVAAMAPPVRRMVLLSRVEETVHCDGWPFPLGCNEYPGAVHPEGHRFLRAFSHHPCPRWAYQGENWTLQKELVLLRGRNTVVLTYTLLAGNRPVELELRPLFALRPFHDLTFQWNGRLLAEPAPAPAGGRGENGTARPAAAAGHWRIAATSRTPEVFFASAGSFEPQPAWYFNSIYRREQERGYAGLEDLWTPGVVRQKLAPGQAMHLVCSADRVDLARAVEAAQHQPAAEAAAVASHGTAVISPPPAASAATSLAARAEAAVAALHRAADQYIINVPAAETAAAAAATSDGPPAVAVHTHYPWSTPSGRGAMIGFAGLFLVTGRFDEGKSLLVSMAGLARDGLMPSEFPENGGAPLYQGADVSLWFAAAVWQYLRYTGDQSTARRHLLEPLLQIVERYRRGTRLGIKADADGLVSSHEPGLGTSWMDAKVGDWVVTQRQGRPVELNALWYNAVCIAADLAERFGRQDRAKDLRALAASVKAAFNRRFWNESAGCCYDVVSDTGADPAVRPNQIFAIGLPFAVLSLDRHGAVVEKARSELLTPFGLRTLSPADPNYQGKYAGGVVSRDRAYHNGSAYPWLLGPFVTASLRVHGRAETARREAAALLQPCVDYLNGDGLGQVCELFDGNAPHHPGGALASAPAVAEILRAYEEDVLDRGPVTGFASGNSPLDGATVIRPLPMTPKG